MAGDSEGQDAAYERLKSFERLQNCVSGRSRLLKYAHERRRDLGGRPSYTGTACFDGWNLAKWPGL